MVISFRQFRRVITARKIRAVNSLSVLFLNNRVQENTMRISQAGDPEEEGLSPC